MVTALKSDVKRQARKQSSRRLLNCSSHAFSEKLFTCAERRHLKTESRSEISVTR